jgi:lipoprotein
MMNIKKFLAVILVTIIAITVFAGCDVITKNEERDYNQSLATVKYAGLTSTVTKGEFNESFNSLAYYYVYYYGYTVDEAATSILDSLAQRKLLILYVRDEIAKSQGVANTTAVADLLNAVEKNEAVKSANESMAKWYKQVFEELWKEANSTDDTTDDTTDEDKVDETDKIAARPTRPDKKEAEVDYTKPLDPAKAEIKFFEKPYKDLYTEKEWDELNKVEGKADYIPKALNELKKQLADNYKSYDYYLNSAYETQLISKYKRELVKDFNPDDAAIKSEYDRYVSLNKEKFSIETEANYKSAISSSLTNTVYHPTSEHGYGYVFNILFKFSDEQSTELKNFTAGQPDKTIVEKYRAQLANKIEVMKSNPDYDPDEVCEECEKAQKDNKDPNKYCTKEKCNARPYEVDGEGIIKKYNVMEVIEKLKNELTGKSFEEQREIATQYVYMYNDDTGMYNTSSNNAITAGGNGYLISPHETDKTYVEEFSKMGRELVKKGLGSYDYCITDYGIHFMFVSYIPYDTTVSGVADDLIPLDYIVYYGRSDDENDKNKTLRDVIVQDLKSKNTEARYQIAAQNAIAANKDNSISRNKKVWEKTVKELKKSLGVKD